MVVLLFCSFKPVAVPGSGSDHVVPFENVVAKGAESGAEGGIPFDRQKPTFGRPHLGRGVREAFGLERELEPRAVRSNRASSLRAIKKGIPRMTIRATSSVVTEPRIA